MGEKRGEREMRFREYGRVGREGAEIKELIKKFSFTL
jgi:hypothetical protein